MPSRSPYRIELNESAADTLRRASCSEIVEVFAMMQSSPDGLSEDTAEERSEEIGLNEVRYDRAPSPSWARFKKYG